MNKNTPVGLSSWYNTPYYHILNKEKNDNEAETFMETLTNYLNLPEQGTILNVGCGRGQHALSLNSLGFDVTGIDPYENNIKHAKKHENNLLSFDVHDMHKPYKHQYDAVFNLITNFGYFGFDKDNLSIIKALKANLNETGFGVIDCINSDVAIENLVAEETKTIDKIDFNLKQFVHNDYIVKDINFEADGKSHHYQEHVKAHSLKDFEILFEQADTYLLDVFGDYKLNKFRPQTSERMVMIFK